MGTPFVIPGPFADHLERTPHVAQAPFYPDKRPLDVDNDLLVISDTIAPVVGEITQRTGHVLTPSGQPVRNATVEIWQVEANGV